MKVECAMFKYMNVKDGVVTVWNRRASGDPDGYVRISEWVEVDFTMLPGDVTAESTQRAIEAKRARLQRELAELEDAK